jgi:hypothetical protein
MAQAVARAGDAVEEWIRNGIAAVMDRYNAGEMST